MGAEAVGVGAAVAEEVGAEAVRLPPAFATGAAVGAPADDGEWTGAVGTPDAEVAFAVGAIGGEGTFEAGVVNDSPAGCHPAVDEWDVVAARCDDPEPVIPAGGIAGGGGLGAGGGAAGGAGRGGGTVGITLAIGFAPVALRAVVAAGVLVGGATRLAPAAAALATVELSFGAVADLAVGLAMGAEVVAAPGAEAGAEP